MNNHILSYGTATIEYSLDYSNRKTLGIKVLPDTSVLVQAPLDTSIEKIEQKVKSKASWIIKQKDFFLAFHPLTPQRKYVSGETHLYLGKQYRLKLRTSSIEEVKLKEGYINVYCKETDNKKKVKELLNNWYLEKAKIHFTKLFNKNKPLVNSLTNKEVNLKFRWMSKRWGSCDIHGNIHLNVELIKASKRCIEYVIIHEMCHLKYFNHSAKFYALLKLKFPNYLETKQKLENTII